MAPKRTAVPGRLAGTFASVTVITDCGGDDNAKARLLGRLSALFPLASINVCGITIGPAGLLEAGLNTCDVLSAGTFVLPTSTSTLVLINAAPRATGEHDNGVPFGSFFDPAGNLVVTTMTPEILAFLARFDLVSDLRSYDIREVMDWAAKLLGLAEDEVEDVVDSQFRSLMFQPLLAWLINSYGEEVPHCKHRPPAPALATGCVARIDGFGNVYLDVLATDLGSQGLPEKVQLADGIDGPTELKVYRRLADAPHGELVAVLSSSGYQRNHVLMVCRAGLDGPSAAEQLSLSVGDPLIVVPQPA